MEVVVRTATPEVIEVMLFAIVSARILEQHAAVVDLAMIDRTTRGSPMSGSARRPGVLGQPDPSVLCDALIYSSGSRQPWDPGSSIAL